MYFVICKICLRIARSRNILCVTRTWKLNSKFTHRVSPPPAAGCHCVHRWIQAFQELRSHSVSSLFEYHPIGYFLRVKAREDIDPNLRVVAKKFFKALSRESCILHRCLFVKPLNLFLPSDLDIIQSQLEFRSFKQGVFIHAFDPDNLDCKSPAKSYRATITTHSSAHLLQAQAASAISWSRLWHLSLFFTQRNVVYRFIHDKIPTRLLLFRLLLGKFPSGACVHCSAAESKSHFFFDCPVKSTFWDLLILSFFGQIPPLSSFFLASTIYTLLLSLLPTCSAKADVLIVVALSEIWKAHWRSVFDGQPFSPAAVLSSTILLLERRKAEDEVHRA